MFQKLSSRSSRRSASHAHVHSHSRVESSSSSPLPKAVRLYQDGDDEEEEVSSSEEEYRNVHHHHKKHHKKHKKGRQRSLAEELRWCFITGRLGRIVWKACALFGVTVLSFGACSTVLQYLQEQTGHSASLDFSTVWNLKWKLLHPLQRLDHHNPLHLSVKPPMMGFYFTDVDSHSFTGVVQHLTPPQHSRDWMAMLQHRLEYAEEHHSRDHHRRQNLLPPVAPLSDFISDAGIDIEEDSEFYEDEKPELTPNPDQCTPQYDWQIQTFSNCNTIHESAPLGDRLVYHPYHFVDEEGEDDDNHHKQHHSHNHQHHHHHHHHNKLRRRLSQTVTAVKPSSSLRSSLDVPPDFLLEPYRLLAHGYWRDTWKFDDPHGVQRIALKTARYHHNVTEYLLDKQRRDAVTSDRIAFSPHAIRMYAACGTTALYEYAPGGDLEVLLDKFDTPKDFTDYFDVRTRYVLGYNVSSALADLHNTEGPGRFTGIVHGDFKADQFVAVAPVEMGEQRHHALPHFKLGDFNLARFVYWNHKYNHPCVIRPDGNGGSFRAPEEYASQHGRTEKVDIYSLGNLLYTILTGHWPFDDLENAHGTKELKHLVKHGRRPHINIDADLLHSQDPMVQTLLKCIEMCWRQDPHERASAREIEELLAEHMPEQPW